MRCAERDWALIRDAGSAPEASIGSKPLGSEGVSDLLVEEGFGGGYKAAAEGLGGHAQLRWCRRAGVDPIRRERW